MHFTAILKIHAYTSGHVVVHFAMTLAPQLSTEVLNNTPRHTHRHSRFSWTQLQMELPRQV